MERRQVASRSRQRVRVSPGVYRKPNGKYLATFRDPGRKQHWKEFATKREAERWRAQGLVDPRALVGGRRTLEEVWASFIARHEHQLRPTTRATWTHEWRKYIWPALGSWPVGKITIPVVKDFLASLERQGVGAATRAKCRSVLHRLFEEAVEDGEVASNPVAARGTRVKTAQPKRARVLTPAELERVLEAAEATSSSDTLAIELMFTLGLRIGEMAGLQARDVDVHAREITIQRTVSDPEGRLLVQDATKTNKYRVLPVPAELGTWQRLVAHIRTKGLVGAAHLFAAPEGGVIRPNNWRRRVWDRAMRGAKIDDPPTPHSGRRTTASLLSAAGAAPATVQAVLGHASLGQTSAYIDVPRAEMELALSRLTQFYRTAAVLDAPRVTE